MDATNEGFPPTSPPLPDDYMDVESEENAAAERTKYQRGGRKQKTTNTTREIRTPPVPESQAVQDPEHREELKMEQELMDERLPNGTAQETCCPSYGARKGEADKSEKPEKRPTPFETGIRAFNLKRAASSGGRPVSVRTADEGGEKSKQKSAKKRNKKKKAKPEAKESENEEDISSEEDEEPATKPMAIKLDLDLVIEIFLKAKIQGAVTITFLE